MFSWKYADCQTLFNYDKYNWFKDAKKFQNFATCKQIAFYMTWQVEVFCKST